jgi:betaine reductase
MIERQYRIVHYLNQFFSQIGGEEKADIPPLVKEGAIGPGVALQQQLGSEGKIVATVICGDNHFAQAIEAVAAGIARIVGSYHADVFVAGPAFNAGRYGVACGAACAAVSKELRIPVITAMYEENPALELYRKSTYIIPTARSVIGMKDVLPKMATLMKKLASGQELSSPQEEGYFARGIRVNQFSSQTGSQRAVDMLLLKLKGLPFQTEYSMPSFERIPPSQAIGNMSSATIALVTTGGIVPKGNPDRIEAASASKFAEYSISGINNLDATAYQTCHGGYDPVYANDRPDRVLPLDAMRILEKSGMIARLHNRYYVTVGNATSVANSRKFGESIAEKLKASGVDGVILTST